MFENIKLFLLADFIYLISHDEKKNLECFEIWTISVFSDASLKYCEIVAYFMRDFTLIACCLQEDEAAIIKWYLEGFKKKL